MGKKNLIGKRDVGCFRSKHWTVRDCGNEERNPQDGVKIRVVEEEVGVDD